MILTATRCSSLRVEPEFLNKVVRYQDQELKLRRSEELSLGVFRKKWFPFSFISFATWISVCLGRSLPINVFLVSTLVNLLAHHISFIIALFCLELETGSEQINKAGSSSFERQHSFRFSKQEIQPVEYCVLGWGC